MLPRLHRPASLTQPGRGRANLRRLDVESPLDRPISRVSTSRASVSSALGSLAVEEDEDVFPPPSPVAGTSQNHQQPRSISESRTRQPLRPFRQLQLQAPSVNRDWLVPDVIRSERGGDLRIFENCRFKKKYIRFDVNEQVQVWHCNESSNCRAVLVTDMDHPYSKQVSMFLASFYFCFELDVRESQPSLLDLHTSNHLIPTHDELLQKKFIESVKVRASVTNETTRSILQMEALGSPPHVGAFAKLNCHKRTVQRAKKLSSSIEAAPSSLSSITTHHLVSDKNRPFVLYDSGPEDVERIIIFGDRDHVRKLKEYVHWAGDGSFKCTPKFFLQIFTFKSLSKNQLHFRIVHWLAVYST